MFIGRNHSLRQTLARGSNLLLEEVCRREGLYWRYGTLTCENVVAFFLSAKIKPDDEVLLPNFMCSTLIDALTTFGIKLNFYSVDVSSGLAISEKEILEKIGPNTKAVMFVDYFGAICMPSPLLLNQLKEKKILALKDAAHSFLSHFESGFQTLNEYDAVFFSLYKVLPIPAGAIAISKTSLGSSGLDLKMFLLQMTKNLLKPLAFQVFPRLMDWAMVKMKVVSFQPNRRISFNAWWKAIRLFCRFVDYEGLIQIRRVNAKKYLAVLETNKEILCRPVFNAHQIGSSSLLAFPVIFLRKAARDQVIYYFLKKNVDCYTWPTFSDICIHEENWNTLLLIPVSHDVSSIFAEALESVGNASDLTVPRLEFA